MIILIFIFEFKESLKRRSHLLQRKYVILILIKKKKAKKTTLDFSNQNLILDFNVRWKLLFSFEKKNKKFKRFFFYRYKWIISGFKYFHVNLIRYGKPSPSLGKLD